MRTCCPTCQTVFRVTSEQLRLRAGKVRCGQCRAVFNAIDNLADDAGDALPVTAPAAAAAAAAAPPPGARASTRPEPAARAAVTPAADTPSPKVPEAAAIAVSPAPAEFADEPTAATGGSPVADGRQPDAAADGATLPDELRGPSRTPEWLAEVPDAPSSPGERSARTTFVVVAAILACVLAGQLVFHLRGRIAISAPALRPALEVLSAAFGSEIPLPRQAALVSIESSDLQADPERNKLLVLQAALRNRAAYAQAYPALELTLTDSRDKAVARRVLLPEEYLSSAALEEGAFAPNADLEVRVWLEAQQIDAAGYRLYVFYP
ncbi:MAG: family finger-like domain protein [Candidatus Accumulibacter sp. SK-11]|nr:MAG: family finger-like domain protein [Candidatus Accumulibacter sp. SK-11]HCV13376.1 hypothetical protein [Accumulibacter sp.]